MSLPVCTSSIKNQSSINCLYFMNISLQIRLLLKEYTKYPTLAILEVNYTLIIERIRDYLPTRSKPFFCPILEKPASVPQRLVECATFKNSRCMYQPIFT